MFFRATLLAPFVLFSSTLFAQNLDNIASPALDDALRSVKPAAVSVKGDTELFKSLAQPYGPLDLVIQDDAIDAEQASSSKNFFFGAVGSAAKLDKQTLSTLINSWFDKPHQTALVQNALTTAQLLPVLGREVNALGNDYVLSAWGENAYRFNQWVVNLNSVELYRCEGPYFPCTEFSLTTIDKLPETDQETLLEARRLITKLRNANVTAVVQKPEGTRYILDGISDNETGLYLPAEPDNGIPDSFSGGKAVQSAVDMNNGTWMYRTN